ncbi:hypothetical protein XENTR_v10011566 [Xenopus tropicalis]|uniref:Transport and Golgi organization protein 6 homolog n=1 Tax=Xenopus tropicalis TaxID=8364 RepID=F6QBJ5_XENTR|nr:transport and Golgi organization protein 6 homolog [Xenopus tropicalis]KAE8608677.1 hypothetical protein XENTR_v10011566 [Xenopus tropicalis]|eukprot:XP_002936058.2 PREDICTED: transport and Golgi organization protein 6 homolog [Xenopus tropicalis]
MAEGLTISTVIEALKVLTTPRGDSWRDSGQASPETDKQCTLLNTLKLNVSTLEDKILNGPEWKELNKMRMRLLAQTKWLEGCFSSHTEPHWRFTLEALLLLLCLKECMIELVASFQPSKPNPRTPEVAPALSPDTLSISQQKIVQAVLQFVISLGICPYLLPGVGLPIQQRSEFGALVRSLITCETPTIRTRRLFISCSALMEVSHQLSLGSLLLTHYLGDLMAGLCQLGFCPSRKNAEQNTIEKLKDLTESERNQCKEFLKSLLDQVYQPLVIRELLILQGGPRQGIKSCSGKATKRAPAPSWLRRLSGHLLSERLMKPHGVQAVVRGILEGAGAGAVGGHDAEAASSNWEKCDAIARILVSCPQQSLTVEEYYQKVCPQILDLLHIQDPFTARQFQRVATEAFLAIGQAEPQLAEKHLILPVLEPLLRWTLAPQESVSAPGHTLVTENELSQCLEDIMKVFVVGNKPTPTLLHYTNKVLPAVFCLYCFARQNVSHLRSPCQDVLLWYLDKSERECAVSSLAGLSGIDTSLPSLPKYFEIKPASHGGAIVKVREKYSADDDDALYEKVSWEQWRTECLVELLSLSPSRGLAADFFLLCLKNLIPLSVGTDQEEPASCHGINLLDLERRLAMSHESQEKQLQLLQVLSVLCEKISDSIFTDVQQVVEFVYVTLERSCASLAFSEGGTVASQTLSMAMGLVAAMLGGAVMLTSSDFGHLKKLLPVLERVSLSHLDPVIQELAKDLRVSIATHCAVQLPNRTCQDKAKAHDIDNKQSKHDTKTNNPVADQQNFKVMLNSARDTDIPTRAAALRTLTHLLEQKNPMALEHKEQLLQLFLENLDQEDSFVYLSAIQGVAVLSGEIPECVLPVLVAQYGNTAPTEHTGHSPETKIKVGEALMRCTRVLGNLVLQYKDLLIHAFLRGSKDQDSSLRASSLSNLGELCQHLQFSLGTVVHEISSCLCAVVRTDPEAQVRRAAIHVVVLLLRGLSEKATEVLRDVLLDLYRLLKFVVQCETDSVSVLHAQLGLEELDSIMRAVLFPQQKLEKKIVVLP